MFVFLTHAHDCRRTKVVMDITFIVSDQQKLQNQSFRQLNNPSTIRVTNCPSVYETEGFCGIGTSNAKTRKNWSPCSLSIRYFWVICLVQETKVAHTKKIIEKEFSSKKYSQCGLQLLQSFTNLMGLGPSSVTYNTASSITRNVVKLFFFFLCSETKQ